VYLVTLITSQISATCPISFSHILVSMIHTQYSECSTKQHSCQSLHQSIQPHSSIMGWPDDPKKSPTERRTHCDATTPKWKFDI